LQWKQGDQVGRIFAHWVTLYFKQFFENYKSSKHFGLLLATVKAVHQLWQKIGRAIFWALFLQMHLVTLSGSSQMVYFGIWNVLSWSQTDTDLTTLDTPSYI
jgi:hypothetical protein